MRSFILVYTRGKFTPLSRGAVFQRAFRRVPGTHIPLIRSMAHKQAGKLPLTPKKEQFIVKEYLSVVSYYKNKVPTRFISIPPPPDCLIAFSQNIAKYIACEMTRLWVSCSGVSLHRI